MMARVLVHLDQETVVSQEDFARTLLKATDFKGIIGPQESARLFPQNPELHVGFAVAKACQEAIRLGLTTREDIDRMAKELGWAYSPMEDDWW